jgi:hypothetical protein
MEHNFCVICFKMGQFKQKKSKFIIRVTEKKKPKQKWANAEFSNRWHDKDKDNAYNMGLLLTIKEIMRVIFW